MVGREDLNLRPRVPNAVRYRAALRPDLANPETESGLSYKRGKTQAVRFGHCLTRNCTLHHVYPLGHPRSGRMARSTPSEARRSRYGECRIGQRSRGMRHDPWHIRDAMVDNPVHAINGIRVRSGRGRFTAAALIHGHIDNHGTQLHPFHEVAGSLGRPCTRDQDRADDQICLDHRPLDGGGGSRTGRDAAP